jgi:uncharacterized lipoprotein YbaY
VIDQWLAALVEQGLLRFENDVYLRPAPSSRQFVLLTLLARTITQTLQRFYMATSLLLNSGQNSLSAEELEDLCVMMAQRLSILHGLNAPEFFDKSCSATSSRPCCARRAAPRRAGKLGYHDKLGELAEGVAKRVLSAELRLSIRQVALHRDDGLRWPLTVPGENPLKSLGLATSQLQGHRRYHEKALYAVLRTLLAACSSQTPSNQASLDGEVFYLQRIALPPAATLSVALQDVSLMDAPAVTLASQNGPVKGNVPLPFHHLRPGPGQARPPLRGERAHRTGWQAAVHQHRTPWRDARRQRPAAGAHQGRPGSLIPVFIVYKESFMIRTSLRFTTLCAGLLLSASALALSLGDLSQKDATAA